MIIEHGYWAVDKERLVKERRTRGGAVIEECERRKCGIGVAVSGRHTQRIRLAYTQFFHAASLQC